MKDKISLAGVKIHSITRKQAVDILLDFSKRSFRRTACYVNAHCINTACYDKEYRDIQNKFDLVYAGGQGVVWASRFFGIPLPERVNILDFFDRLLEGLMEKRITVYLLGGKPEVVRKAGETLKKKGLNVVGSMHGFFDKQEEMSIIREINELRPDILMVGMGVPKQEKWIFSHLNELQVNLCWAVGLTGTILNTTDGGKNWNLQTSGVTFNLLGVQFINSNVGYAIGWSGTILKTIDGGINWNKQFSGASVHLTGVHFINENIGWITGDYGTILHTTNGGVTFVEDKQFNKDSDYSVYPNPFTNNLNIDLPDGFNAKNIIIYDLLGIKIKELQQSDIHMQKNNTFEIDSEDLPTGVYFIQIGNGKAKMIIKI